jgi:putative transposase
MRQFNGMYTQSYNRRHNRVGHVFQGRYKAILVDKESYLLEVSRYIVLNPVRANMVRSVRDWRWSSYRATAGMTKTRECLNVD